MDVQLGVNAGVSTGIASTTPRIGVPGAKQVNVFANPLPQRDPVAWAITQSTKPSVQFSATAANPAGAVSVDATALALIAQDVHRAAPNPPAGFRIAAAGDLGALGLRPGDLSATQAASVARVYVSGSGEHSVFVVAYRTASSGRSDVAPRPDQIDQAQNLGKKIAGTGNVILLGEGMAASLVSATLEGGRQARPAMLANQDRPAPFERNGADITKSRVISAFALPGALLSAMQDGGNRVAALARGWAL